MEDQRVIALSKTKLLLLVAGACIFVAAGYWMFQMDSAEIESQRRFNSPTFVHGVGILTIVFAIICGAFGVKKLFDTRPGLVLNSAGLLDNSSGVSAGFIPWAEITGFGIFEVQSQKTLVVNVTDPEKYIEVGGPIRRKLNRVNYKMVGSPIAITSNSLNANFTELLGTCNEYFSKYKRNA